MSQAQTQDQKAKEEAVLYTALADLAVFFLQITFAIAKGRAQGVAQVLLTLGADASEFDRCPVDRAAYVEFPDVGLIDILRARLRL